MTDLFENIPNYKNFILLGTQLDELKRKAHAIVSEAEQKCNCIFNGETAAFEFNLRYTPPFEKNFRELMRLQGVAAENARFKDEYRGYIIIDVCEFLKHEAEPYFQIAIRYLHDENDNWRYIFIVDKANEKAAKDLTRVILEYIKCTKVIDDENILDENRDFLIRVCKDVDLRMENDALGLFENLFEYENVNRNVIESIIFDLSTVYKKQKISIDVLKGYFESDKTLAQYIITNNTLAKVVTSCKTLGKRERT